jgi:hypothetical protein
MLEAILKPISVLYCGEEYTRDSTHYLESLMSWKEEVASNAIVSNHQNKNIRLIAADVQSLYPGCNRELVKKALQEALSSSTYSTAIQRIIIDLVMYCMENVVTQYGEDYYLQKVGIITGDNNSVSIANIAMRYVMKMACDSLSQCSIVRRFIDDIMMIFMGSLESAENIKRCVSEIFTGQHLSLTF